jgi:hypothetical protein
MLLKLYISPVELNWYILELAILELAILEWAVPELAIMELTIPEQLYFPPKRCRRKVKKTTVISLTEVSHSSNFQFFWIAGLTVLQATAAQL